jgi:hypothetical protein
MTDTIIKKWSNEFLQEMSLKTDPFAESIIKEIALNDDFSSLRNLFIKLNTDDNLADNSNLPQSVINYFNTNNNLPEWANLEKIKIAQNLFLEHGPEIALILNYKALPLCYACKNGAKVLATTGRLISNGNDTSKMMRRLLETSQMVINVMSEGGLSSNGKGIISVKKVRLYHAAIRYFLLNPKFNPTKWDTSNFGQPINQEEMAGTLSAFSTLVINGLNQLGIKLTEEQKDSYVHCWNIVGHFIGLDPKLYPNTFAEGWDLGISIIQRNQTESSDGKFLVSSLIKNSQNYFFKGELIDFLPSYLINFFIQDVSDTIEVNLAKVLGIEENLNFAEKITGKLFLKSIGIIDDVEEHSQIVKKILEKFSSNHLQELINQQLKVNNVEFFIPDSLKANWNMN